MSMPRFGRSSGVREFKEFREFAPATSGARYVKTLPETKYAPSGWLKMARSDGVLMSAMNGGWVCLEKFRGLGSGFRTLGLRFRSGGGWIREVRRLSRRDQ